MHNPAMRPLSWELQPGDDSPNGVIGDRYWTDVSVTVEVRLNAPGDSFMLGQRVNMANLTDYDCVKLQIYLPGMWMRWDTTGVFDVTDQANRPHILHTGKLPVIPTPGTWHNYTLSAHGFLLSALMDGVTIFDEVAILPNYTSGWVGYGTKDYGHHADFDNIRLEPSTEVPSFLNWNE